MTKKLWFLLILFSFPILGNAQEIELYDQFTGRVDYLGFGNTMNEVENPPTCTILTESSATLQLESDQEVLAAYLYWGGSGSGDLNVALNGTSITAERVFNSTLVSNNLIYFAAFADVTAQIQNTGSGLYTLSELDLTQVIIDYCDNSTNYAGWAIMVIYEDPDLPINQLNIFDGLDQISRDINELTITLTDLETVDNSDAKIGFLTWEGDQGIAVDETLQLNGTVLSNPPLNPSNNAFNGTNTFTNSDTFYNMDLDFYSAEGLIEPGDDTALITLTSGQDLILINNIITVLNVALPDATITMDAIDGSSECGDEEYTIDYTVYNTEGTDRLPPVTIGFFGDDILMATAQTTNFIEIGQQESGSITFTAPSGIPADFTLTAFVDYQDLVNELDDQNNEDTSEEHLFITPNTDGLINLELCDVVGEEFFNLTEATAQINPINTISYHFSEEDAENNENPIPDIENFENTENPQTIWVRVSNPDCFTIDSFTVEVIICPLPDATITIDNDVYACRQRDLLLEYTVYNTEGTAPLPSGTEIAFYGNDILLAQAETQAVIPIGASEFGAIEITLPESLPDQFLLKAVVDDNGNGEGSVQELNEFNNEFEIEAVFGSLTPLNNLPNLIVCDEGFELAYFDFYDPEFQLIEAITQNDDGEIQFFTSLDEAILNINPIPNPNNYQNLTNPQTIYVRLENEICFTTGSFQLLVEKCAPEPYQGVSPNGDGINDVFNIDNLYNVFDDFDLKIYSREGNLIYEGQNEDGPWDGIPNRGILQQNKVVPVGTYYYVLILNDPDFPEPIIGYLYINY